ncbi:MAG: response regulator transcription factor [Dehalococcoidia bacterium]
MEDQALIRASLRAMLELEPEIEVVGEAPEANQALQEIEAPGVDIVLMDIGLPGMDGIQATRLLKQKHQGLPVVMLTSYQDEYVAEALEAGASGYILKSSTRQQLVQAVKSAHDGQAPIDPSVTGKLVREIAELKRAHADSLLTPRQVAILKLVASGTKYKEIASELFISETTVNREMRNIYNRLGVNDAAHAVSEAYKKRLI